MQQRMLNDRGLEQCTRYPPGSWVAALHTAARGNRPAGRTPRWRGGMWISGQRPPEGVALKTYRKFSQVEDDGGRVIARLVPRPTRQLRIARLGFSNPADDALRPLLVECFEEVHPRRLAKLD